MSSPAGNLGNARGATAGEFVERAAGLRSLLADRAEETEALGRLAPEVVAALRGAELLSLGPPAALGGPGADIDTMVDIGYELARGCMSTAWCWQIWTLHSWFVGFADERAQREVYAQGPSTIISSGYNPRGATVELVDGGCMLSGRWGFSSGIDYANWVLLGVELPGVTRPKGAQTLMLFVPRSDLRVLDDWKVMGLRGTGSKTLVIDAPVFVPEHRYLDIYHAEQGPASTVFDRASYALPVDVAIAFVMTAPFVGAAQAIIDDFAAETKAKTDSFTGAAKAQQTSIQMRIGDAAAEAYAAISMTRESVREMLRRATSGEGVSPEQRATYKLAHVYGVELARRAATRLFEISGVAGMQTSSPMLRRFSDLHTGSKHFGVRWDEHTESYGRTRLGLGPSSVIH